MYTSAFSLSLQTTRAVRGTGLPLETQHILTDFIFSLCTLGLGSQAHSPRPLSLTGSPSWPHQVHVRGYTHILPAAQDGDLALSHFHWKTTASGYHRCQQWCQGGGVGHDAVGSSSCRGWRNLLCLHILPGSLARLATRRCSTILPSMCAAGQNQRQYVVCTHLDSGSYHHPDDCSQN